MDPIEVPETLSALSQEELVELSAKLTELAGQLTSANPAELSDEQLDFLEYTADGLDRVTAELDAREADFTARSARADAVVARFSGKKKKAVVADEETPAEDADPTDDEEAELAASGEAFSDDDDDEAPAAPVPDAADAVVASGRQVGRRLTEGLSARRPETAAPRTAPPGPFMVTTGHVNDLPGMRANQGLADTRAVAEALTAKRLRMGNVPEGVREKLSLATGHKSLAFSVGQDAGANLVTFEAVRKAHVELATGGFAPEALVASGGCCAPFTPLYEFFRIAEAASPIEDSLPVVEAPRGGIRYIPATDWRDAAAGIGTYTCADGLADGTPDPIVYKPVVHMQCPGVEDAETQAVTEIVSFDNLQYRVFPELVESFQADLAVAFADRKERLFLAAIDAASTAVTETNNTYGAARTVIEALTRGSVQYRARHAMGLTATLVVYLEAWVRDALASDILFDAQSGIDSMSSAYAFIDDALRARNLQVVWHRNLTQGAGLIAKAQAAGALNAWGTTVVARYHAPGTIVRLDGGSLDVGLYRDSTLNQTNDVEMFMEEWHGTAFTGAESVKLTIDLCVNGAAPLGVTAIACA